MGQRATGSYGTGSTHVGASSFREKMPRLTPSSPPASLVASRPLLRVLMSPCTVAAIVVSALARLMLCVVSRSGGALGGRTAGAVAAVDFEEAMEGARLTLGRGCGGKRAQTYAALTLTTRSRPSTAVFACEAAAYEDQHRQRWHASPNRKRFTKCEASHACPPVPRP